MNDKSFVVKVRFEEESRNLIGFFMILASSEKCIIMKSDTVVNYFTERFARKINLIVPWASFLERIAEENEMISELMLKDFSAAVTDQFEGLDNERVAKLAEIVLETADMNLKQVMLTDFLNEELIKVFPKGELAVEFVTEIIGEEEEDEDGEDGEDGEEEESEDEEDEGGKKEGEAPDGIETIAVDPVVDPVDGIPACRLKEGDNVAFTRNRDRLTGPVLSVFPASKGSDRMVVKVQIDDETWGQMVASWNTMILVERPESEKPKGSSDFLFYAMLIGVIVIIVGFLIALVFGMM